TANEFEPIAAAARQMDGFGHPWFVLGGWAIDLFVGRVTRPHGDREMGVFRHHQESVRAHFKDRALFKAVNGADGKGRWEPWLPPEQLELPVHQILVRPAGSAAPVGDWEAMEEEFEIFLNEAEEGMWRCRRDGRITRPMDEIYTASARG